MEQVIVAMGKRAQLDDPSASSSVGVAADPPRQPPLSDDRCRVAGRSDLWGAGDVTGLALEMHTRQLPGADGGARTSWGTMCAADYRAIPRGVYTDPAVASVGLTAAAARAQGHEVAVATFPLARDGARLRPRRRDGPAPC